MFPIRNPLLRHLTWAIVLKLLFITALWWLFVRDARRDVDTQETAAHFLAAPQPSPTPEQEALP